MGRLLHLVEFAYKNGYQTSLKMSPSEALYGRKYNTLVSWDNPANCVVVGSDLLQKINEQMVKTSHNLKFSKIGK
jgi:hypothetical protein